MPIFKIAVLSGLVMAGTLVACSPSNYNSAKQADAANSAKYVTSNAAYAPNQMTRTSIGQVMATPQGMTVYTFDKDQIGKSNCYDECASHWPPVIADGSAKPHGRMSLAARNDGQQQWAYDGKPLYTYAEDEVHGDVNGEDVGNVWHVVR